MPPVVGTPAQLVRWRLAGTVGATVVDVYVMVPASYQWALHSDAVKMQDPCDGTVTILRTTGTTLRFGRPTMHVEGANRAAVLTQLRSAWAAGGPWTLTTPTETLSVIVDPTQGDYAEQNFGHHWEVSCGFQAV